MIEAPIGQGGMGEVYRAFDEKLRRKVALKVIHPDLAVPDAAARMVREARAAAALAHPNTIAIYDLGEIDGNVFLVMELVSGASLRAYVGDTTVPVARKIRWLVGIARGLGAAHKAGLVHRDVKPTNVMVSDEDVVKVLDFGLAKPVEAASFRTDVGLVVGTPGYMAPELFTGVAADARSDQFAFGVTAYELLAGVHPGNPMGAVPAALDTRVPEIGPAAARIIARTLSRAADDRFATMNEVASALEEQIAPARVSAVAEVSPPTRREGVAAKGNAQLALALAPTELEPSRANGAALPARGWSSARVAAILGVLAIAGVYGGRQFLADSTIPGPSAPPPPSSASSSATTMPAFADLLDAAAASSQPEPSTTDAAADAAGDAPGDASADASADAAGDAAGDAATERPRRTVPLDDFPDPWVKPAPAASPR